MKNSQSVLRAKASPSARRLNSRYFIVAKKKCQTHKRRLHNKIKPNSNRITPKTEFHNEYIRVYKQKLRFSANMPLFYSGENTRPSSEFIYYNIHTVSSHMPKCHLHAHTPKSGVIVGENIFVRPDT